MVCYYSHVLRVRSCQQDSNVTLSRFAGQTKDFKLPPIDYADKTRCVFQGSNMGQSNAARDKLYDLRECKLSGKDASGLDLSGVIMTNTDVSNTKFAESYFSKGYLHSKSLYQIVILLWNVVECHKLT